MCATEDGGERSQTGAAGDQEHDKQLILYRIDRFVARNYLAGHHPRQRNEADRRHAIHYWHEAVSQSVPYDWEQALIPGAAEGKTSFHSGSLPDKAVRQHIKPQADTRHGISQ